MDVNVAAAQVRVAHAHAQGFFKAQGRTARKQRQGVFVTQNHGREVQTKIVHKARFK